MEPENHLDQFLAQYKIPIAISLVGVVLLIGGVISSGILPKTFIKQTKTTKEASISNPGVVAVDVSGEVSNPGVYKIPSGSRVEEAIQAAGGVTESADPVYVAKSLNLAQKVADGMKIYIPKTLEAGQSGSPAVMSASNTNALVNINTASEADLDKLPGVGAVTAQKIIDNRPFSSLEELVTKKAVSKAVYEKIKDQVSVW